MGSRFVSTTGDGPRQAVDGRVEVDGVRNADGEEGGVRASWKVQNLKRPRESELPRHNSLTRRSDRCMFIASAGEVRPRRMHVQREMTMD